MGTQLLLLRKRGQNPPPIFGPFLLWPNGWIDQDATWYRGKPRPRRLCVRCRHSFPRKKGHSPTQFLAHVYCGQTAGWIKMRLGTEVMLGRGDVVLDGVAAPPPLKGAQPPIFGPCPLWPNGWMDQDATWYGGRPRPRRHCVRWRLSSPSPKEYTPNVRPTSIATKRLEASRCHMVWRQASVQATLC